MSATNRSLRELITLGQFREDLFYRINVIHIEVPPLRERREDIQLLIDFFLARFTGSRSLDAAATRSMNGGFDETDDLQDMEELGGEARGLFEPGAQDWICTRFHSCSRAENGNGIRNTNLAASGVATGNGSVNGVNSHSPVRAISKMAMDALSEYSWPGMCGRSRTWSNAWS
jgi:hypothetical protein